MSQGQVDLPPAVAATTATSPTTSNSHRRPAPDSPTIDSESAASPSYTSSTSAASASEPPRKRHRPRSLDLKSGADDSSHVALRIVSPGLPPLNSAEMRSTLKISQRIEQQQRELIASRAGVVSANTSINENGSPASETRSTIITVNAQPTAADELDRLSTPSSAKRLKRSNVPSPLSIGSQDSDSLRPAIHSAPIRYYGPPVAKSQFRPFPNTHVTYSSLPPLQSGGSVHPYQSGIPIKRSRPIYPYTTTSAHFPRAVRLAPHPYHNPQHHLMANQRQGPHRSASPPLRSPSSPFSVTDVYHGDLMKTAPLQSQPLSAQRDYFESQGKARMSQQDVDDDRLPVSEDEIREMQEKYKSSEDLHEEEEEEDDDEEDAASRTGVNGEEIFGSINIMNESIFNFRIFNPKSKEAEADDKENEDTSGDWLAKEKDKFLRICETSWDKFVNSRKQM
ncbi:predicted protein [Scheffersomyces stipitis CBS 6054]|uniref:Uncharacterized protein n=1 Tax=Scheffersomyces stipitis (strain ATCC 58785 / CBS 6054 / NBRC 10063 / NRRL Y-11545) TaxID=322104 RepID=A3LNZ0_PICST|nr:predicted protein [Scheffersomyces stipitis CBS 6054]ABN64402.2 predicted protein [Scheffersomyces stipitis CBS 6054]